MRDWEISIEFLGNCQSFRAGERLLLVNRGRCEIVGAFGRLLYRFGIFRRDQRCQDRHIEIQDL